MLLLLSWFGGSDTIVSRDSSSSREEGGERDEMANSFDEAVIIEGFKATKPTYRPKCSTSIPIAAVP